MAIAAPALDPKQVRAALRVLDTLDRWDKRANDCYSTQRTYSRKHYRAVISVIVPPVPSVGPADAKPVLHEVFARNLSQGGLSFIFPSRIHANQIVVGLKSGNQTNWLHADIVRSREVQDGYWEFGAAFRDKLEHSES